MRDTIELIRVGNETVFSGYNTKLKVNGSEVSGVISLNINGRDQDMDNRYSNPNEARVQGWGHDVNAATIVIEAAHVNRQERLEQFFRPQNIKSYSYRIAVENVNRETIELYANRIDMIFYQNKKDMQEFLRGSGILSESI